MAKHYKGIIYRFKDKEQYKEFMKRIQYDEESSFQSFVDRAIRDYLNGDYNPYKRR